MADGELLRASRDGDLSEVKRLVEVHHVNPNTSLDGRNMTPLHHASQYGHLDIVRYLVVERNCDTERENGWSVTPLHLAAGEGRLDVVKCLIGEAGCNPMPRGFNVRHSSRSATPLHMACDEGKLDVVKYLVEDAEVETASRDDDGITPLHCAVFSERLPLVKLLVEEYKCDPGVRDNKGQTPADWARRRGSTRIASYLSSIEETVSSEWEDEIFLMYTV